MSLNMVLVGAFSYLSMNYAANSKHRLIRSEISDEAIKEYKKQILTEPGIAILAAGLVFVNPVLWDIAFILIPVLFIARKQLVKVNYFQIFKKK